MKLPGPNYATSTPSRGSDDIGGPLSVASSFAAIGRSRVATAGAFAQASNASARAAAGNSQGIVTAALNNVSGIIEAWMEAEDKAAAAKAFSEYREKMSAAAIELAKTPVMRAQDIPEGVVFKRTETRVVDGTAQEVERELVPTWEVAPALYDKLSKEASAAAMKAPQMRSAKNWLENNIRDTNSQISNQVASHHFEGRKAALQGSFETSIQGLVNSGDSKGALDVLAQAARAGVIDPVAAVKRQQKIMNDSANMLLNKQIITETDPVKLEAIGDQVLNSRGVLTDEQASSLSKQAFSKAERLMKKEEALETKEKKIASSAILTDFVVGVRLNKKLPSRAEMQALVSQMTDADTRQAMALYDRKDGGEGKGGSDKGVLRSLTNRLIGSTSPEVGSSMDERVRAFRAEVDRQFTLGTLERKDWVAFHNDAKNMTDRVTVDDPNYKLANESIYANIAKNPKGTLMDSDGSKSRYAVAVEMETALFRAQMANPKLDPIKWAVDNQAPYQAKADLAITDKLRGAGLTSYLATNKDGGFDESKTQANIRKAYSDKRLTPDQFERAMNLLLDKAPVAKPARKAE